MREFAKVVSVLHHRVHPDLHLTLKPTAGASEASPEGRGVPEAAAKRARDTGEAQLSGRDWWAVLDGQARDQSRLSEATDPHATETVLELRLGARFGSGTRERDRERALEEAAVVAAARGKAVAASWLDSSRRDVEDATGDAVAAAEAACEPAAVPALPRTLEMPTATESSSSASAVSWAASRRKSSPRDMVPQKARQRAPKRGKLR